MLSAMFSPMIDIPMRKRRARVAGRAQRAASMKYSSCPRLHRNIVRRYGSAAARTSGDA